MHSGNTSSYNHAFLLPVIFLVIACAPWKTPLAAQNSAPRLSSDTNIATAGYFQLSWETDADRVELQESAQPDFTNPETMYTGPDRAAVVSGKKDGTWYYRIRALDIPRAGPWSEPVAVEVKHHSINRALIFLSLGIIIFISLVSMVVQSSRHHQ